MRIGSPEFKDGGEMPERFGYIRDNVNPRLEIEDVPAQAEALVLIMDDPDAVEPAGKIWLHWTLWNIDPETTSIEEDSAPGTGGTTDFQQTGYGGPNPPDEVHNYVFRLYALDSELDIPSGFSRDKLEEAIEGKVLEEATLEASYAPTK